VTLTSRAFHNDQLGPYARALTALAGMDRMLPMNTGVEAVESALKIARRWGYDVKGVPADQATIIVAEGNFHGRTLAVISFSTDPVARRGFGPYLTGFRVVPFGDAEAVRAAIDDTTVAVLVEPIQGEAGVNIPPPGYLSALREVCTTSHVLLIADEIQSGLGRTGETFACDHEGVVPDLYLLGKALGGGILPVSAVVGREEPMAVLHPGEHGSTFGGNPLACAVGLAVVGLLATGEYQARARTLGERLRSALDGFIGHGLTEVRGRGLWFGLDVDPAVGSARQVCERLVAHGVLAKDTHESTVRLAPPLVITAEQVDQLVEALGRSLVVPG
jgi:ornithine--oxo-acid transaminase